MRVLREPSKKAPPPKNPSRPPKPSPSSLSTRLPPLLPKHAMQPEVSALERWQNRLWCQGVGDEEGRRRASLFFSRRRRSKISMTSSQLVDKLWLGTRAQRAGGDSTGVFMQDGSGFKGLLCVLSWNPRGFCTCRLGRLGYGAVLISPVCMPLMSHEPSFQFPSHLFRSCGVKSLE